ncbi:YncE family protein [Nocardioides daejeonensis]|uniref:YncE family protein n=1 Tax=Nocardioides daejeonensis TaxID=1046556 RepID=UPI0019529440|nr:hypothetical protein [Nocardioides daejeonensis]
MQRTRLLALSTALAAGTLLLAACGTDSSQEAAPPTSPAPVASSAPVALPQGRLLVADFDSDTVTFVDPAGADAGERGSVRVGTAPYGIALGEDGTAWVSTAEGVAVVDTESRKRTALIGYRTEAGPATTGEYRGGGMGIALSPDGSRLYVGVNVPGGDGFVEVVDTARREVVGTVQVGMRPFDVDVSADGREVYATNHDSYDVTIIDTSDWSTRSVLVDPYDTGRSLGAWLKPHYAVVRPSDGKVLLPFEGERLLVVDPDSGRVTEEPMTADTHQHGIAIGTDGTLFVVGTGGTSDSGNGPSLTIRTPAGRERVIPLDGPHEEVAISGDGRTAYVSGGFTRDGYWDGISIVDVRTGTVTRLPAGERPLGIVVL